MDPLSTISSLKRDEIYSFLGGLFAALCWSFYIKINDPTFENFKLDFLSSSAFIIAWLFLTTLIFIFQSALVVIFSYGYKFILKNKSKMDLKAILGLKDPVEDFITVEFFQTVEESIHLYGLILVIFCSCYFPLSYFFNLIFQNQSSCLFNLLFFVIIIFLLFLYSRLFKFKFASSILISCRALETIDGKKYSEERAIFYSKIRNQGTLNKLDNALKSNSDPQSSDFENKSEKIS